MSVNQKSLSHQNPKVELIVCQILHVARILKRLGGSTMIDRRPEFAGTLGTKITYEKILRKTSTGSDVIEVPEGCSNSGSASEGRMSAISKAKVKIASVGVLLVSCPLKTGHLTMDARKIT